MALYRSDGTVGPVESAAISITLPPNNGPEIAPDPGICLLDEAPILIRPDSKMAREFLREPAVTIVRQEGLEISQERYFSFVQRLCSGESPLYFSVTCSQAGLLATAAQRLRETPAAGQFPDEAEYYLQHLAEKLGYIAEISGSDTLNLVMRNHFWRPDTIWHIDRIAKDSFAGDVNGIRVNWSVGRPEGMVFTVPTNIRLDQMFGIFQANEGALAKIYEHAAKAGQRAASELLGNLPGYQQLLCEQDRLLVKNPDCVLQLPAGWWSIHKIDGRNRTLTGTPHRLSTANQDQPGLQAIITAPF